MSAETTFTDAEKIELAKAATNHILNAICDDSRKYWLMGPLTGSWDKLTEAHAALFGMDSEKIEESFRPDEEKFAAYCDQIYAEQEMASFCQDSGITLQQLLKFCEAHAWQIKEEASA